MKFKILLTLIAFIIIINSFIGCIENKNPISKEEIIGSWSYEDEQHKTMTWIFFENNSVLTDFFARGGSSLKVWYNYELNNQDLCFTDLNTSEIYCYEYDYVEDDNKLKVIQGENIAVFIRN